MVDISTTTRKLIKLGLAEDIGHGDITSRLVAEDSQASARLVAKESFVLAGMPFVQEVFRQVDPAVVVEPTAAEGARLAAGAVIARISGSACSILAGERLALNILQRISGVATMTSRFVDQAGGLPVRIVDTRKTTPGMRAMEKYAVVVGGGANHRFGLSDGILIKDNHIAFAGGIRPAIERARKAHHLLRIEVEVTNLDELADAIDAGAEVIMLDNMPLETMKQAVQRVKAADHRIMVEASGNMTLDRIKAVAHTGVDIISVGALTHSAGSVDISLQFGNREGNHGRADI